MKNIVPEIWYQRSSEVPKIKYTYMLCLAFNSKILCNIRMSVELILGSESCGINPYVNKLSMKNEVWAMALRPIENSFYVPSSLSAIHSQMGYYVSH